MAKERRREEESGGGGDWLNTYADMVTLLLSFFVLLFALSQTDEGRIKAFFAGFNGGAGVLDGGTMLEFKKNIGEMLENAGDGGNEELEYIQSALQESVETDIMSELSVVRDERGLVISFMNNVLFDPGEAQIKEEVLPVIAEVGNMLNAEPFSEYSVAIEGHTDTDPVKYVNRYPTNWELSTARATAVARYLVENSVVEPRRLSASGYSYYHPIAPNDTPENKARNRRVDIVILNSKTGNKPEDMILENDIEGENIQDNNQQVNIDNNETEVTDEERGNP